MAALLYKDDHNKVAYMEQGKGWEAYEQILDFLNRSHIQYALTHRPPIVFDSLVKQFWASATVHTLEAGPSKIIATIDDNEVVVTESLIWTHLRLNDENGLYEFTLHDVLDEMREIGYPTDGLVYVYILPHSCRFYLVYYRINAVSCGFLLYVVQIVGMPQMLLVVTVFLLVVLVHADGWVSAGSRTLPNGSCTIPTV
nr:hypothetical protein [Tanacetum cinerariifolium]